MSNRRFWIGLLLVQTVCIACGLGFYYLYVGSSIERSAEAEAHEELIPLARRLAQSLITGKSAGSFSETRGSFAAALASAPRPNRSDMQALLVDADWTVLAASGESASPGDKLIWTRTATGIDPTAEGEAHKSESPIEGLVDCGDQTWAAASYPLAEHAGYAVVCRSRDSLTVHPGDIIPTLRGAGAIAWLWTCGLLCASFYMIVTWHQEHRAGQRNQPEVNALKQAQALVRTQETIIFGLAKLSDSRDPETGDHLERISYYSSALASALRQHPEFREVVTPSFVRWIGISSALHDIGKVGVEDAILRKPAALTESERTRMKLHTRVGEECLKEIERRLGTSNFLQMAREIASAHHERWDGLGYPLGLAGEQIPLAARIVAIADVYDALSSKRVYKEALPHEQCLSIITSESGQHFDPRLVAVFLQIEGNFRNIARQLGTGFDAHLAQLEQPAELIGAGPVS